MSTTCLVIARDLHENIGLVVELLKYSNTMKFNINFNITDALLETPYISLSEFDFAFELCDNADVSGYGIFMDLDGYSVNGITPSLPLCDRIKIICGVISIISPHSSLMEIYIESERPSEGDYETYSVGPHDVEGIIASEYDRSIKSCCIPPDIHIIVTK